MKTVVKSSSDPVFISGPRLRQRWGISNSTFYEKLKAGVIPAPEYPFGPQKPYWRVETIEAFENASRATQGKTGGAA